MVVHITPSLYLLYIKQYLHFLFMCIIYRVIVKKVMYLNWWWSDESNTRPNGKPFLISWGCRRLWVGMNGFRSRLRLIIVLWLFIVFVFVLLL